MIGGNNMAGRGGPFWGPFGEDQGYGRGGIPFFTGVFEPLARVVLCPTDEGGLGTWFGAA